MAKMQARSRDVVPLPVGEVLMGYLKEDRGLSASQRRRARKRAVADRWMVPRGVFT